MTTAPTATGATASHPELCQSTALRTTTTCASGPQTPDGCFGARRSDCLPTDTADGVADCETPRITDVSTHLMFQDGSARGAVERYVELIPGSTIAEVNGPDGPGQTIRFTLANRPFIAFNSPAVHDFGFTPAMSIFVTCDTPDEVDELFDELSTEGSVMMPLGDYGFSPRFGWCTDRYGVSWQVACA